MKIEIDIWGLLWKHKMTASELAKKTGISEVQISKIKTWKTKKIELTTIEKLLEAFQCEPNDIFKITK